NKGVEPAAREPSRVGHYAVNLLDQSLGQRAEPVMPAVDAVGRQSFLAAGTQRAFSCLPGFRGDGDAGVAVEPCPWARNPVPRATMRGDDVVANLNRSIGVGNRHTLFLGQCVRDRRPKGT